MLLAEGYMCCESDKKATKKWHETNAAMRIVKNIWILHGNNIRQGSPRRCHVFVIIITIDNDYILIYKIDKVCWKETNTAALVFLVVEVHHGLAVAR